MGPEIAVSGDTMLNRRVTVCKKNSVRDYLGLFDEADIGFTHFEMLMHDYDDEEVYPRFEAGGSWMRAPGYVADELDELGVDIVSLPSNHALDYSFGGLFSTWDELDRVGIKHAGTGKNLATASAPTFVETSEARVALISMTTSFVDAHRAGEARRDLKGRPGVNPLDYYHGVDRETRETISEMAEQMGWWITQRGDHWLYNPPGATRTTPQRFIESEDVSGSFEPVVDEQDRRRNLNSVEEATAQADIVLVHIHTHAWDPDEDLTVPATFLPPFTRECIDAGADIVVCQGTHSPLRGVEVYDSQPIFYDPGDLFYMSGTITKQPNEYYERYADELDTSIARSRPIDAYEARGMINDLGPGETDENDPDGTYFGGQIHNPPGGYFASKVIGNIIPVCRFTGDFNLESITLYPGKLMQSPQLYSGVPERVYGDEAEEIITFVDGLSDRYDADITYEDGVGHVEI